MVSIIIVNYNTLEITCNCIASVLQHSKAVPFELIVVDNASPNDDPSVFLERFQNVKLIRSKENGGFAKGNNLGIAAAEGDIILLLNSDTWLTEDSISKAATHLLQHEEIAALTVRMTYPDGRLQHTARKFRSINNELLDLCRPFLKLLPYHKRAHLMLNQYFNGDFNTECDWVSGAFMMFRKSLLDLLPENKLDERYFMYGEDQLWCYQFQQLGYVNYYLSETTIVHINQASTSADKQRALLKKIVALELDFAKMRWGAGLLFYIFLMIFTIKEHSRLFVKFLSKQFLGYSIK
jgi:GT2 family glycosyltransferase